MAGRPKGSDAEVWRLKRYARDLHQSGMSDPEVAREVQRSVRTVQRWLQEIKQAVARETINESLTDAQEYRERMWFWTAEITRLRSYIRQLSAERQEVELAAMTAPPPDAPEGEEKEVPLNPRIIFLDMLINTAAADISEAFGERQFWSRQYEPTQVSGAKAAVTAEAQTSPSGQSAQFYYNSEEFYREIREYRRRVPLLAGQQGGLLESPEAKKQRVAEFIREYGTEKLPSEIL